MNYFLSIGALFGLLGVMIGAFGAHGLEGKLTAHALARFQTGVEYQFYHVGTLLIIGVLLNQSPIQPLNSLAWLHLWAGYAF